MQIAPGLQFFVTDHTGRRYPATAAYLPAGATVGGPLDSGQSRLETIDFELDAQANPDHVSFELDSSSEPVVVGLP